MTGEPGERAEDFDPAAIDRLRRLGGAPLVRRMARLFVELGEERLAAARAGITFGDPDTIERAAHSLKSSAGNVGAWRLHRIAGEVEDAASRGLLAHAADGVGAMEAAFAEARRRIEDLTEEARP